MDDIRKLEEIGLKEVSNKTHIDLHHLESMVNSEFDKLNRSSTVGFVKILSREYKIDLSEWLEEAEKFWKENREYELTPKIFIADKPKKSIRSIMYIFFLILLCAILYGAYIFLNKKLDFFENPLSKNDTNYTYEETPVVSKAKESLIEDNISFGKENNKTIDAVLEEKNQSITQSNQIENNISEINNSVASVSKESNQSIKTVKQSKKDENLTKPSVAKNTNSFISPNSKLWIGVIYLDNHKRKSFLGKNKFMLDISRDQLITTGHGHFNIEINGVLKKFNSQNPLKLLIKNGSLSVLTNSQFKELNKGSLW